MSQSGELERLDREIAKVNSCIESIGRDIAEIESQAFTEAAASRLHYLREEKKELREEKKQLYELEIILKKQLYELEIIQKKQLSEEKKQLGEIEIIKEKQLVIKEIAELTPDNLKIFNFIYESNSARSLPQTNAAQSLSTLTKSGSKTNSPESSDGANGNSRISFSSDTKDHDGSLRSGIQSLAHTVSTNVSQLAIDEQGTTSTYSSNFDTYTGHTSKDV